MGKHIDEPQTEKDSQDNEDEENEKNKEPTRKMAWESCSVPIFMLNFNFKRNPQHIYNKSRWIYALVRVEFEMIYPYA